MSSFADGVAYAAKRAAYGASQAARIAWFTGHYLAGRRKMGAVTTPGEAPYAEEFGPLDRARLRNSFRELFRTDWRNIKDGLYRMPLETRRPPSPARLLKASRDYLEDSGRVARRRRARGHSEVLSADRAAIYPRYFLQNFHYQTDGWLSPESAERYDMQVETLFTGAASAMRRQALPAIRAAIGARDPSSLSLLDVACGTGSFLEAVKDNWPLLHAAALDLSPAYLGKTRATLANCRNMRFVEANAEATGLADASFDIATIVYLFHELPPATRRMVAAEAARILKPGGTLVHVDTIQYGDEPGLDVLLETFPRAFHEPYYDGYCREDLGGVFSSAGFDRVAETVAFLSKVSVFRKA
jgi:ubiquinone/menaquinone biosynthesis C-methylase UbiE